MALMDNYNNNIAIINIHHLLLSPTLSLPLQDASSRPTRAANLD
jgi:hypothetical protein